MPEIVVKTDDPVYFGLGNIERLGQQGDDGVVYIAKFFLKGVQHRQKSAGKLL
jgi:hypothetical protein